MRARFIRSGNPKRSLDIGSKRGMLRDFDELLIGYGFVEDTPESWPKMHRLTDIRRLYHYHYIIKPEFRMEIYEMNWKPGYLWTYFYEEGLDYEHSHYNSSMEEYFIDKYFAWDKLEKKLGI